MYDRPIEITVNHAPIWMLSIKLAWIPNTGKIMI